jgi:hypothetical protein
MLYNFNKLGKDRLFKGVGLINLPGGGGMRRGEGAYEHGKKICIFCLWQLLLSPR